MTTDYILSFDGDDKSFSYSNMSEMVLHSISVSFWLKTSDDSHLGTPFSYANKQYDNAFTLTDYSGYVMDLLL